MPCTQQFLDTLTTPTSSHNPRPESDEPIRTVNDGSDQILRTPSDAQHPATALETNKKIVATCPAGQKVGVDVALDLSATSRDNTLSDTVETILRDQVTRTAVCEGHIKITGFATSAVDTAVLLDEDLSPSGQTENARLNRVPDMVDEAMATIDDRYSSVLQAVQSQGTDVLAQFQLAREYIDQLNVNGRSYQLQLVVITDGVQNEGVTLNTPDLTTSVAKNLAEKVDVVSLKPAHITITGIGRIVSGDQPPTSYVDALKTFYITVCGRTTDPSNCSITTDYTKGS